MIATGFRLSFKQWLIIAFLAMGFLFGASHLIAINTLDFLSDRSQTAASKAVALNELNQELSTARDSIERYGRQYTVLGHPDLLQEYNNTSYKSLAIIQKMAAEGAISQQAAQQWQLLLSSITHQLSRTDLIKEKEGEHQTELLKNLKELELLQLDIRSYSQIITEERSKQLVNEISQQKRWMRQIILGLFVLTLLLSITLGAWLSRPFRRIETAIQQLGENQFKKIIDIHGPSDVRKLGQRLDWLRIRLAEIDADKSRFLRHTSHEFKTPLASLREGVSLLQEELAGPLNNNQKDVVHILQQNSLLLQNQIEALLQFNAAAFDAKKLNRKPTKLLELIEDEIDAQQLQWQAYQLQIDLIGEEINLEVDAEKIQVVITNLLSNAIRFSPQKGVVSINLSTEEKVVFIDIKDQGPGIDPEDCSSIFDPFYRGKKQPVTKTSGTGIGLSVVHEFITAHGGGVQLIPSEQGAHFRIQLPYVEI